MSVSTLPPSLRLFSSPLSVVSAGIDVAVLPAGRRRFVNLDLAATSPCSTGVWQVVTEAAPWLGSVHRGSGVLSESTSERFEAARRTVAAFVGARADDAVVFTQNSTGALNLLAHCLPPDASVITFASEHHANLLPWPCERTLVLPVPESAADAVALVSRALAATTGERLVAVAAASNVTGEVWPLAELAAVCQTSGARLSVDAAQLVAHRHIDIAALGADYVAFSGHKMFAPLGAGALVGRPDWLLATPPFLKGGGATTAVTAEQVSWREDGARHEAGTPNTLGVLALAAACRELAALGWGRIEGRESALRARLEHGLAAVEGLQVLQLWPGHSDRVGVLTFTLDGWDGALLAAVLSAEHGIGVRAGKFCAHRLVDHLLAHGADSNPAASGLPVRVSWGASSTAADIDALIDALRAITRTGPACEYTHDATGWHPRHDTRPACW